MPKDMDLLLAAARAVDRQAMELPGLGVPVDPEVADFMGAFVEDALSPADLDDELLLDAGVAYGR